MKLTPSVWERVVELFHQARILNDAQRDSFLAAACAGDSQLRSQVDLMLGESNEQDDFLERVPVEILDATVRELHEPGDIVSHYRIESLLGTGGMGSVYQAEDIHLRRRVALKFLAPQLIESAADPDRLLHEARAAAAIHHPNVCTVYEVNDQPGQMFIAMALLHGRSLAQCLANGPIPESVALGILAQAAAGLQAAHEKGVIHRDIKPANIMISDSTGATGSVSLLDFGLAQVAGTLPGVKASHPGGTVSYMSPEQVSGDPVDHRTDIWSLGIVLFEMLFARRPFDGPNAQATFDAIMHGELRFGASTGNRLRQELEALLLGMLAKRPQDRFASAAEVRSQLTVVLQRHSSKRRRFVRLGGIAAAMALCIGMYFLARPAPAPEEIIDASIDVKKGITLSEDGFAISPDGNTLLFHSKQGLVSQRLADGETKMWAGSEAASYPFWSPDGREVGYYSYNKLWRRTFPNGIPHEICAASAPVSASWGTRNIIVFSSGDGPIYSVKASGGAPVAVTRFQKDRDAFHASPAFLPDGMRFVFYRESRLREGHLMLGGTAWQQRIFLLTPDAASSAVFLPRPRSSEGQLVFARHGALISQSFDQATARLRGKPLIVIQRVKEFINRLAPASASNTGALVYVAAEDRTDYPKLFDRNGRLIARLGSPKEYQAAIPSPDFSQIALSSLDHTRRILTIEILSLASNTTRPFLVMTAPTHRMNSVWSPHGDRIAFGSVTDIPGPPAYLFDVAGDGKDNPTRVQPMPMKAWPYDWSPDGRVLLVTAQRSDGTRSVWSVPLDPKQPPKSLAAMAPLNEQGHFSPDGHYVAFHSEETGVAEIYVIPYPPDGRKWRVSNGGGMEPRWRADGKELFFLSTNYALMSTKVEHIRENGLSFSRPVTLFGGIFAEPSLAVWHFEPSPDGQRFVILTTHDYSTSLIRLRLNWWADEPR